MADEPRDQFSPNWGKVAHLKPRLREHVDIHRHVFRDQTWFVLQDFVSGRFHRFSPMAYAMIGRMDGKTTLDEIWSQAQHEFAEDPPSQEDLIEVLTKLYSADAIISDVIPDTAELHERSKRLSRSKMVARMQSPLAVRIPLFDPDRFLNATIAYVRPFIGWFGAVIWIVTVAIGLVLVAVHQRELLANLSDRVLAADNLIWLWLAFSVIKLIHEFGHAYTIKRWGGEVHEIGIMFLVFFPVPYVEASASYAFASKWRRAGVAAAGIGVELFIAAVAVIVWANVEPGLVRALAFNAMFVAGVSTLLLNGNPLLRFDGYYVLSDVIESPNLGPRSNRYLIYLLGRKLFKAEGLSKPILTGREVWQLPVYGIASFLYRFIIIISIVTFVATHYFFVGILIAIWSLYRMFVQPVIKGLRFLATSHTLRGHRGAAIRTASLWLAGLATLLLLVPAPWATMASGAIWIQDDSIIRTEVAGFVKDPEVTVRRPVEGGTSLLELESLSLRSDLDIYKAQLKEALAMRASVDTTDPVTAYALQRRIDHLEAQVELATNRVKLQDITAPSDGIFLAKNLADLDGSFLDRGMLIGYVFKPDAPVAIVVVRQEQIDLIRSNNKGINVRLASDPGRIVTATVNRISPASTTQLPTPALSKLGGGPVSLDPTAGAEMQALDDLYFLELQLPEMPGLNRIGEHIFVRFDHGLQPLGLQAIRRIRQIFLERFNV